uniref:Uncharacterized protein n=1 Tax=Tanacetum cinerariifolium TaxID=118510 RepID=A0A6L2M5F0_TANCI|nr:hypothetical protein [Tanacetum cinerariifolium]
MNLGAGISPKTTRKRKHIVDSTKEGSRRKTQRVPPQASKVFGDASDSLYVDSDLDIHGVKRFHRLPLGCRSYYSFVMETTFEGDQLGEAMEVAKEKAYAELERKCNIALQDLEKNPIILDMCFKIETLYGHVDKLHTTDDVRSDEMGLLVSRLVKVAMFHGRCIAFEEVANLKEPFVFEKMPAIVEQLLSKKPRSLRTKPARSYSKPSSLKAPIN